ncbi:hypothetical protein AJ78_04928 [Emergomyces pasteurianus Ep9510]|uniref:Diphthamide biosynthesis protein 4 n=1 Tax=Emergomyces pasteurianus Ep9510 TaxID=1447872 RepID=A0A1J9PFN6_9EURO|nr:hypothetical protein AJ78_04928 [Emergomyces pasteurianus Ep9510]
MTTGTPPTHYSILNIPYPPSHSLLKQDVKIAYHRALLKHHPDKAGAPSSANPAKTHPTNTDFRTNSTHNGTNSKSPWIYDGELMAASNIATEARAPSPAGTDKDMQLPPLGYTIDQIATAYKVLSDPVARAEYDRSLRLLGINGSRHRPGHGGDDATPFRTGMEVFDLDDMEIGSASGSGSGTGGADSSDGAWYHSCRCGEERGFLVLEEDLEREAERGEVVVGCRGCSLWARVVFAIDNGAEDEIENDRLL